MLIRRRKIVIVYITGNGFYGSGILIEFACISYSNNFLIQILQNQIIIRRWLIAKYMVWRVSFAIAGRRDILASSNEEGSCEAWMKHVHVSEII